MTRSFLVNRRAGIIVVWGSEFSCQEPSVTVTSPTYQLSDA
jgi:hypothetical protein